MPESFEHKSPSASLKILIEFEANTSRIRKILSLYYKKTCNISHLDKDQRPLGDPEGDGKAVVGPERPGVKDPAPTPQIEPGHVLEDTLGLHVELLGVCVRPQVEDLGEAGLEEDRSLGHGHEAREILPQLPLAVEAQVKLRCLW